MASKLFGKNIAVDCQYCDNCIIDSQGAQICIKNKCITNGKCRKFAYNPLMRKPFKLPVLPKYNPEDFML
ncbi:MAG: hypothetical protein K2M82_06060 [Lachnospiraceae bacterium]|nr:hypothetical protein [Lachnospiraceae bacterium]